MSQTRSWWRAPALWALLGALGIMLIVIYGANRFFGQDDAAAPVAEVTRNASPGIDGVIAANVPADQLRVGDCLQGFNGPLEASTVVTCLTAHNAQLIGTFTMDGDQFPGPAGILSQSEELCKSVALDPSSPLDTGWSYHFSRPSEATWKNGDRLVACFLALNEGSVRVSMLPSDSAALNT
ncbi:hypothetical protein [Arthrobacter sp. AQ5-05]|uniref:hypothetical protein n=1 Tax=Arthrobacter sp. AQ5-05 TaxID=2184581 RepID=UPI0011BF0F9B|nr:hypothetical protein [Arthrobacter sp. AQ5-05]